MFIIYGKIDCSQCQTAKSLLNMQKMDFEYKVLDVDYKLEDLLELTPAPPRSFPVIFNDDVYIGGFNDLVKLFKE